MKNEPLKSWTKIEILAAKVALQDLLVAEGASPADISDIEYAVEDILGILEGKLPVEPNPQSLALNIDLRPPDNAAPADFVMCPGIGFVPVLGQLDVDKKVVIWHTDDDTESQQ